MTVDEVAELTGLSREEAVLAQQRDFDEPFIFEGKPDDRFLPRPPPLLRSHRTRPDAAVPVAAPATRIPDSRSRRAG